LNLLLILEVLKSTERAFHETKRRDLRDVVPSSCCVENQGDRRVVDECLGTLLYNLANDFAVPV